MNKQRSIEKSSPLRPEDAALTHERWLIAHNGVKNALHSIEIDRSLMIELEAEHQAMTNAAMAASLGVATMSEMVSQPVPETLDIHDPVEVNTEWMDAARAEIAPDDPAGALMQDRQDDYDLAGGQA